MTPLTSAIVLLLLAIAVIALFAWRLRRVAATKDVAVLPEPSSPPPPPPITAHASLPPGTRLEGTVAAGD